MDCDHEIAMLIRADFTHEPRAVTIKIVRAQKKVSKGRPNTPRKIM